MEKLFYLKNAITIIEKCISDKMNINRLACECFISPRQFYRDFYSLTGHTINEYIRKRRLSRALNLLRYSKMSMADIACLCGYSSQAAFCQTVKYYLNMTATEYKNNTSQYYFPVFNSNDFRQIEVKTETIPKTISIHFYDNKLSGIENRAIEYWHSIAAHYKGRIFGRNEKQCGNRFCYELMIEYSDENMTLIQNSKLKVSSINPSIKCSFATTIVKNNEQEINAAWDYLYTHWLKNSMFEQDKTPYFEEYLFKNSKNSKLILYLPVIPRLSYFKINVTPCGDKLFIVSTKKGINSEKLASDIVINFIAKQYPHLLETQKEYYVSKSYDNCTCGMRVNESRYIPDDGSISLLTIQNGMYASLEGACFGGSCEYENILMQWIIENGYEADDKPFTIYDISKGMKRNELVVKSYIKIKWQKNIRQSKI
jgi:AraC family transcriptional regulator